MLPDATPAYLQALTEAHDVQIRGVILNAGQPDPRFGPVPLMSSGATTMDRTQLVRRKSTVTVADPSWVPSGPASALASFGLGMRVYYGIRSSSLPWTWAPIITAHILSGLEDAPFAGVPVTLVDQMWRVSADEFPADRSLKGSALGNLKLLISESIPWATFDVDDEIIDNDVLMPSTVFTSRIQAVQVLAESLGADLPYTDAAGTVRIVPVPDPMATPVWAVRAGEGGVLVKASRTWSSQDAPNSVICTGQSKTGTPPVSDLVVDEDPTSPTYYRGISQATGTKYPNQVKKLSGVADTKAGVNIAARAAFRNFIGQSKSISLGGVANPMLEDGDVIVVLPRVGAAESQHLPDSWTLQHSGAGMDIDSRAATLNDAGAV